jgi:hypothetical protein
MRPLKARRRTEEDRMKRMTFFHAWKRMKMYRREK